MTTPSLLQDACQKKDPFRFKHLQAQYSGPRAECARKSGNPHRQRTDSKPGTVLNLACCVEAHVGMTFHRQVQVDPGGRDIHQFPGLVYGEASGGWQSAREKTKANHDQFKNGQWNHYHITAKGRRIVTKINGEVVEDFELKEEYYNNFKEGFIGLQVHSVGGDPKFRVSWRNIYIKELK